MNSQVNYFRVGLFVIALGGVGIALTVWLLSEREEQAASDYVAYMTEAVSGLSALAPVKLNGVQVGTVSSIRLDPDDASRVAIVMTIVDSAPITADTVAVLDTQGITGIAFVQLTGGTRDSPPLPPGTDGALPKIRTGPSLFLRMDEAVSRLLTEITVVAEHLQIVSSRLNQALAPENLATGARILTNVEKISGEILDNTADFAGSMQELRKLLKSLSASATGLPELGDALSLSVRNLDATSETIRTAAGQIAALARTSQHGFEQVSGQTLPAVNSLVSDTQALILRAHDLIRTVEQRPSVVLFGNDIRAGPGE